MMRQPVYLTPIQYVAHKKYGPEDERVIGEATSLRVMVALVRESQVDNPGEISIEATFEGWDFPLAVPKEFYAFGAGGAWVFQPLETVAPHWRYLAPYAYFAVDLAHGVMVESPNLRGLVEQLHKSGHSFVHSFDLKVGARFAREDSEADDVIPIPLSFICLDYDPEDEDVFVIDENWDDDVDDMDDDEYLTEHLTMCSPLPKRAELLDVDSMTPHFLFAGTIVQTRRLRQLLTEGDALV